MNRPIEPKKPIKPLLKTKNTEVIYIDISDLFYFAYDTREPSLQEILDKVPAGVAFSDVTVKIDSYNNTVDYGLSITKNLDWEQEKVKYELALKVYKSQLSVYNSEKKKYDKDILIYSEWKKKDQIEKKKLKLIKQLEKLEEENKLLINW